MAMDRRRRGSRVGSKLRPVGESRQFYYLGDMLDCEQYERTRVAAAWGRWREIASFLVNCSILLRTGGRVYEASVRSALLCGEETWALTSRLLSENPET